MNALIHSQHDIIKDPTGHGLTRFACWPPHPLQFDNIQNIQPSGTRSRTAR
jgi:hypothetical protein